MLAIVIKLLEQIQQQYCQNLHANICKNRLSGDVYFAIIVT